MPRIRYELLVFLVLVAGLPGENVLKRTLGLPKAGPTFVPMRFHQVAQAQRLNIPRIHIEFLAFMAGLWPKANRGHTAH